MVRFRVVRSGGIGRLWGMVRSWSWSIRWFRWVVRSWGWSICWLWSMVWSRCWSIRWFWSMVRSRSWSICWLWSMVRSWFVIGGYWRGVWSRLMIHRRTVRSRGVWSRRSRSVLPLGSGLLTHSLDWEAVECRKILSGG